MRAVVGCICENNPQIHEMNSNGTLLKNWEDPFISADKNGAILTIVSFTRSNATALVEVKEELYESLKNCFNQTYETMYSHLTAENGESAMEQSWWKYIIFQKARFAIRAPGHMMKKAIS